MAGLIVGMAVLVAAIYVFGRLCFKDVDARHKAYPRADQEAGPESRAWRFQKYVTFWPARPG
jgi:hypothetical protein